jgi:hypothetical protein
MRILFYGDRRRRTIACFVDHSLPAFFLPPLPCCCPRRRRKANQLRLCCFSSYIFSPLPSFCSLLGCIISSIVLNSLSQRHDNLYLSSQANSGRVLPLSPVEACQARGGANCTFPFRFITVSAVRSLRVYKLHHRITALTVEQKGQPINIIPSGLVFQV